MLILAIFTIFVAIILGAVGFYRTSSQFAVGKRIERVMTADAETPEEELAKPFVQRVLLPLGDSVARLFRGYTPTEVAERTQKKLVMAGLFPRVTAVQLIGLCWFSAAGCVILMFLMILALGTTPGGDFKYTDPWNIAYLLIGAFGGYILPQFVLGRKVRIREDQILTNLPYSIDILSISVEAGMGFDAAVGYTMRKIKGPLARSRQPEMPELPHVLVHRPALRHDRDAPVLLAVILVLVIDRVVRPGLGARQGKGKHRRKEHRGGQRDQSLHRLNRTGR